MFVSAAVLLKPFCESFKAKPVLPAGPLKFELGCPRETGNCIYKQKVVIWHSYRVALQHLNPTVLTQSASKRKEMPFKQQVGGLWYVYPMSLTFPFSESSLRRR